MLLLWLSLLTNVILSGSQKALTSALTRTCGNSSIKIGKYDRNSSLSNRGVNKQQSVIKNHEKNNEGKKIYSENLKINRKRNYTKITLDYSQAILPTELTMTAYRNVSELVVSIKTFHFILVLLFII